MSGPLRNTSVEVNLPIGRAYPSGGQSGTPSRSRSNKRGTRSPAPRRIGCENCAALKYELRKARAETEALRAELEIHMCGGGQESDS